MWLERFSFVLRTQVECSNLELLYVCIHIWFVCTLICIDLHVVLSECWNGTCASPIDFTGIKRALLCIVTCEAYGNAWVRKIEIEIGRHRRLWRLWTRWSAHADSRGKNDDDWSACVADSLCGTTDVVESVLGPDREVCVWIQSWWKSELEAIVSSIRNWRLLDDVIHECLVRNDIVTTKETSGRELKQPGCSWFGADKKNQGHESPWTGQH